MGNTNNNDIGNRIQQSVTEALSSGDFSKLNSEIRSSVMSVLNDVGDQINRSINDVGDQLNRSINDAKGARPVINRTVTPGYNIYDVQRHTKERSSLVKKPEKKVNFKDVGSVSGPLSVIFGSMGSVVGIVFLSLAIGIKSLAFLIPGVICFLWGPSLLGKGVNTLKWNRIANRYKKLCSEKLYISVDAIANATGTSQKKTVKNIKKVLEKGFFPEGFIDEDNTTLMVSKEVYDQYVETKRNAVNRLVEENNARREQEADKKNAQMRSTVAKGTEYINRLHELNDRIPGVVISEKLSRLEGLLREIFNRVSEHPETVDNCGKLMDYYLPTMIKLVEAYEQYDKVSQPGEDIRSAKAEIENTLDIINQSFVELLNKLYQNSVWDVKSDAKVLKTMLKQEGLAAEELGEVRNFGTEYVNASIPEERVAQMSQAQAPQYTQAQVPQYTQAQVPQYTQPVTEAAEEEEDEEEQWSPGVQRLTDADVEVLNK